MNTIQKRSGQYLGTRIEHKRWQRYSEGEFTTRGRGEYWIQNESLYFQRHASQQPISLPLNKLAEIKVCPCTGRTGGIPVLKLVWEQDGRWLISGFVLSGLVDRSNDLLRALRNQA